MLSHCRFASLVAPNDGLTTIGEQMGGGTLVVDGGGLEEMPAKAPEAGIQSVT
jgi:hypothetical protein